MFGIWTKSSSNAREPSSGAPSISMAPFSKTYDKKAAKRLLMALMKRLDFVPKPIITDKLCSYGAAKAEVAPSLEHWSHKGLNNRSENSHLPFRKRQRTMQGHRSPGALQRFVSMHSATRIAFQFRPVAALRKQFATIGSKLHIWMHGKLRLASPENPRTADPSSRRNLT
jgi:hypothetical protein